MMNYGPFTVPPTKDRIVFDGIMSDISTFRVKRDDKGSISYFVPGDKEVLLLIECKDGGITLVWEKEKWEKGNK